MDCKPSARMLCSSGFGRCSSTVIVQFIYPLGFLQLRIRRYVRLEGLGRHIRPKASTIILRKTARNTEILTTTYRACNPVASIKRSYELVFRNELVNDALSLYNFPMLKY